MPWQHQVSVVAAFLYGLASFLSPCILPLLPAYLGLLAGEAVLGSKRGRLLRAGLLFVLGFSIVFITMGASATLLGNWLKRYSDILRMVSAVLVIFMGLTTMGVINLSFLMREKRLDLSRLKKGGVFVPFLLGLGFALGWTPCIGPVLTSVLLMAANETTMARGILLLVFYSLGIGLPFMLLAALSDVLLPLIKGFHRHMPLLQKISGGLMVLLGLLMLTGWLDWLATI